MSASRKEAYEVAVQEKMPNTDTETPCAGPVRARQAQIRPAQQAHWIDEVEDEQGAAENGGLELAHSAVHLLSRQAAKRDRRQHVLAEQEHRAHEEHDAHQTEREACGGV